jgi:hypothetical protein
MKMGLGLEPPLSHVGATFISCVHSCNQTIHGCVWFGYMSVWVGYGVQASCKPPLYSTISVWVPYAVIGHIDDTHNHLGHINRCVLCMEEARVIASTLK